MHFICISWLQFQIVSDSSVPNTALIWLLGLTHMQDHVIGINSVYDGGSSAESLDCWELHMRPLCVEENGYLVGVRGVTEGSTT